MKLLHPVPGWMPAATVVLALAGCATPPVHPNAAASSVQAPPTVPLATKPTAGQEVGAVAQNQVVVVFPPGGSQITPQASRQLDLAARLFRDVGPVRMFASGYSDPTGDEYNNLLLAAKRAQATKMALVARGIPADRLLIQAFGDSELADRSNPTDPGNRRVVITWNII